MSVAPVVIERVVHRTPFGVRFRDETTRTPVNDRLVVTVRPAEGERDVIAHRTPTGVYAARSLPGLRAHEFPENGGDAEPRRFTVRVHDLSGRFHDVRFTVDLPHEGLVLVECGSPPASPPARTARFAPLFSTPARPAPAGMAVVRARLRLLDGTPAAWAALEATPKAGAPPVRGIADARGEVAVFFPYPQPVGMTGSPPAGTRRPLTESTWDVPVQGFLPRAGSPPEPGDPPDLCTFLDQSPATLVTVASPPRTLSTASIEYGRDCVLPELYVRQ